MRAKVQELSDKVDALERDEKGFKAEEEAERQKLKHAAEAQVRHPPVGRGFEEYHAAHIHTRTHT